MRAKVNDAVAGVGDRLGIRSIPTMAVFRGTRSPQPAPALPPTSKVHRRAPDAPHGQGVIRAGRIVPLLLPARP